MEPSKFMEEKKKKDTKGYTIYCAKSALTTD